MRGGEILVRSLVEEGVNVVFGIPGTHVLEIYSALYDHRDELTHVLARYEPGAGFMADGYGRVSGKPGVVVVTAGPGATGLVTPISQSHVEGAPVVAIAGLTPIGSAGRGYYHEYRDPDAQLSIFKPITKWAIRVTDPSEIPRILARAFRIAREGRPGPIYVEVPRDVLEGEAQWNGYVRETPMTLTPDPGIVREIGELLLASSSPVIYAGGGVVASGSGEWLVKVAEELGAPVVTSVMGKGSIPHDHPLHGGLAAGAFGDPAASRLVEEADVVLAVGTRFSEIGTGLWTLRINGKLIQVNVDPGDLGRNYRPTLTVVSDAGEFLRMLYGVIKGRGRGVRAGLERIRRLRDEVVEVRELGYNESLINPSDLVKAISSLVDRDTIITCDAGGNQVAMFEVPVYRERHYLTPGGFTSMGYAIPAAIGAKVASRDSTVIATTGDAAFFMTGMELATAAELGLRDFSVILFNDGGQGVLKFQQRLMYGGKIYGTHTYNMDYCLFARSLDIDCVEISSREDLGRLGDCVHSSRPCLANVHVNPEAVPIPLSRYIMRILGSSPQRAPWA